ncbi:hypothetical protein M9Y10_033661 [Tritrichomonas musculus]|uniref:Initiator binding domain-containing protein n=1 Tax=Tritrichomonas musculus TaxID=1915356 RepID=A0ABR2KG02_9EUKA
MIQNDESSPDSEIINQMNIHFSLLRKQTGKCSVPSKISDEIHSIILFSLQSPNIISFLEKSGLIFFDKCCGINLSILSKKIFSCKSRISECFRRERWGSSFANEKTYKQLMHDFLPLNQTRFWSLREYPQESKILKLIAQYPQIVRTKIEPVQVEKKIEDSPFELTLQKDIFSWTLFDDL